MTSRYETCKPSIIRYQKKNKNKILEYRRDYYNRKKDYILEQNRKRDYINKTIIYVKYLFKGDDWFYQ